MTDWTPTTLLTPRPPKQKRKAWTEALTRALEETHPGAIDVIAQKVVLMAMDGDLDAVREIAERIEGKPENSPALVIPLMLNVPRTDDDQIKTLPAPLLINVERAN